MKQSGAMAQFFSFFSWPGLLDKRCEKQNLSGWEWVLKLSHRIDSELETYKNMAAFASCARELDRNREAGLPSVFLTLEGADPVEGDMGRIDALHQLGVRLITLTWNYPNCIGYPNSENAVEMARGLTPFGADAVEHMNELGMLIDVSHLSDGGFWDVLSASRAHRRSLPLERPRAQSTSAKPQ